MRVTRARRHTHPLSLSQIHSIVWSQQTSRSEPRGAAAPHPRAAAPPPSGRPAPRVPVRGARGPGRRAPGRPRRGAGAVDGRPAFLHQEPAQPGSKLSWGAVGWQARPRARSPAAGTSSRALAPGAAPRPRSLRRGSGREERESADPRESPGDRRETRRQVRRRSSLASLTGPPAPQPAPGRG